MQLFAMNQFNIYLGILLIYYILQLTVVYIYLSILLTSVEWCVSIHFDRSTVIIHLMQSAIFSQVLSLLDLYLFEYNQAALHLSRYYIASVADQFLYINLRVTMQ